MGLVNLVSLSGLSVSIQNFLKAINEQAISFDDLNQSLKNQTEHLIYISDVLDGKTTGLNSIYTVINPDKLIITKIVLIPTTIDTLTTPPIISIGTNTTQDNLLSSTNLNLLDSINKIYKYNIPEGINIINNAAEIIKINIITGATATTYTFQAYIFGFFL